MPIFNAQNLLRSLEEDVQQLMTTLESVKANKSLNWNKPPQEGKWSPIQIIEHLNSYNRYYLPQIAKSLSEGKRKQIRYDPHFKPGWFGNYFTKIMLPGKDGNVGNKMSAPKNHRPPITLNVETVLNEFITEQGKLLQYLKMASETDIAKLKAPISISKFIKLKLGDTFRFLIAHQQRHFVQLKRALSN